MKLRAAILTALLGVALVLFHREENRDRIREAEQWFLDFLVANARDAFAKDMPAQSPDVVLVDFREEDKAEFSAWPPAPLDYIMVLKRLTEHEPEVVAFVDSLRWENADTAFVTQLKQALVPFPSVVLGFELSSKDGSTTNDGSEFSIHEMPVLPGGEGNRAQVPVFSHVLRAPDKSLRMAAQTGFTSVEGANVSTDAVPFVALGDTRLVPSLSAQSVTLFRHVPYVVQRLRFGVGATLSLGDELIVPLNADGALALHEKPQVPRVNALDLMTPDLGDDGAKAMQTTLGKHKAIVLSANAGGAEHARAIATALAMPKLQRASATVEWALAGVAVLLGFWQLRHRRMKALLSGFGIAVSGMVLCLLVFQSSLLWWSPLAALVAVATSTAFCFVWPRGARGESLPQAS